jgi:predicted pyridoxine 5'-phosphate oxidase superfamily flavin-nucleotide-binding protein
MRWREFADACPEIAEPAEERFRSDQLAILGTLRKDGSPRVTPCEVDFADGDLLLGMMWQSRKALDLRRDARITVHSVQCDREASVADVKLYGVAIEIVELEHRSSYRDAVKARIDWAPDEPNFHVFALDVREAGYISFPEKRVLSWDRETGLRTPAFPEVE